MYVFKEELFVKKPLDLVFDFFNTPKNLSKVTPVFMNFSILTPEPLLMKEGSVFDYKVYIYGVPIRWQSLISDYNPPYSFTDIQLRGPHDYWHHQHIFKSVDGGTLITDLLHFSMPFGVLGHLAYLLFAKRMNERMFSHRKQVIEQIIS